jgi:hypothetical protein
LENVSKEIRAQEAENFRLQKAVHAANKGNAIEKRSKDERRLREQQHNEGWAERKRDMFKKQSALWKQEDTAAILEVRTWLCFRFFRATASNPGHSEILRN